MSFIAALERRFGHLAFPQLIKVLAGLQLLTWVLLHVVPDYAAYLIFDPAAIKQGQVWRVLSYVLLPGSMSILWVIAIGFMFMLSDGLEQAWGAFRVNLYLLSGVIFIALGGLLFGYSTSGVILWTSVLFAFAIYFPNEEIMLYFIIPVKIKWLAWLSAAGLGYALVTAPSARLEILFSLLNFILVFTPGFLKGARQQAQISARRSRHEAAKRPEHEALHHCARCGRTELEHPQLEFRVNADGEDVCQDCRAAARQQ